MNISEEQNQRIGDVQDLTDRIIRSDLFRAYKEAFENGTGLAIDFVAVDETLRMPYVGNVNESRFCRLLREGTGNAWETANALLLTEAQNPVESPLTRVTLAGILEAAIPVRRGKRTVGYLRIGQALGSEPNAKLLTGFMEKLTSKRGLYDIESLSEAYYEIPVVPMNRFSGIAGLVTAFAGQLSDHVNRLKLMKRSNEPVAVVKAKQFIVDHLDETLSLKQVADHCFVSSFYVCKVFKSATGMTLTEFTGRLRIEKAKQLLLNQSRSVCEIALEVGFNSLSQFNRLFSRYVGQPPTKFRSAGDETLRIPNAPDSPIDSPAHVLAAC